MWAKQYVVLDVVVVAIGFVLPAFGRARDRCGRVAVARIHHFRAGDAARVLGKRRHELVAMSRGAMAHRSVLAQYSISLIDQMLAILAGAKLISYMIYSASAEVAAKLGTRYLYLTYLLSRSAFCVTCTLTHATKAAILPVF